MEVLMGLAGAALGALIFLVGWKIGAGQKSRPKPTPPEKERAATLDGWKALANFLNYDGVTPQEPLE